MSVAVVVALSDIRARAAVVYANRLAERGGRCVLVTVDPASWQGRGLSPEVTLVALGDREARHPLPRLERLAQNRWPRRLRGRGLVARLYKALRPLVLWQAARAELRTALGRESVSEVVVVDAHSVLLGRLLARRHPGARVGFAPAPDGETGRPAPRAADV